MMYEPFRHGLQTTKSLHLSVPTAFVVQLRPDRVRMLLWLWHCQNPAKGKANHLQHVLYAALCLYNFKSVGKLF